MEKFEQSTELVAIKKIDAIQLFTQGGIEPILEEIKKKVSVFKPDVSTDKGRKAIKSMAHKVARSKTLLDDLGKDLVSEWKTKAKAVDVGRKMLKDELDELKHKVRKPLTDWEGKQKEKEEKHKKFIEKLIGCSQNLQLDTVEHLTIIRAELDKIVIDESLEDFRAEAEKAKRESLEILNEAIVKRQAYEEEQEELQELRDEKAKRATKDREAEIKKEADAQAKKDAAAQIEAEKKKTKAEKERRIEAEKQKKKEIEEIKLDAKRIEAKAKQQKIDAEKKQKAAVEQAKKDEQAKIARQKQKEIDAEKKREANTKHRAKINNAALKAIQLILDRDEYDSLGSTELSKVLVQAIAKGEIPNVKIKY